MIAQALPKTQELAGRIINLAIKKRKPDVFTINSLKKDAEKLKGNIDYADYYDLLGRIAYLENNKNNVISHYENALRLNSNDYVIRHNYASVLANAGLIFQAEKQAELFADKFKNDTKALKLCIADSYRTCKFRKAISLVEKLDNPDDFTSYTLVKNIAFIFDYAGITDDEAQRLCALAHSILETKNLYFSDGNIEIINGCVLYTIYVDLPIEEIFEINWELASIFAENTENMRSDVLMFEYSSVDVLEEKEKHERLI